jgi:pimeloyl-ACP methyl ester carboxylesterase
VAATLARWIEDSFDSPVHLVGNSMGGQIAIHLAARRPDLVRSLVLVNSTGIPFEITPSAHIQNLIVPRGAMSFATIVARDIFRAGPAAMAVAFARLLRDDVRPLMRRLSMPVLLLWGERDPLVPLTYARQMLEAIPNARLEVIHHAGHVPMWENPREFNDTLLVFLRTVEDVSRAESPAHVFSWALAGWTDGIAHREAGRSRDIVLLHGLGMSSEYFVHFARALFERGWSPIAPDLPGFGESGNGPSMGAIEHANLLAAWADKLAIRGAVWVGHSLGCNGVAHLRRMRPDLVREVVCIGPLWSRITLLRFFPRLIKDAAREPLGLYPFVIRAYWRAGLGRWFFTFRRYADDLRADPPSDARMIAGRSDPLPDCGRVAGLIFISGAHACHFAYPEEAAEHVVALTGHLAKETFDDHADDQDEKREQQTDERSLPLAGSAGDAKAGHHPD